MTMHLVRGMSTINSKKRKVNRTPGWQKAQEKHEAWLRSRGVHPDQLKNKKKEVVHAKSITPPKNNRSIKTSDVICAPCPKKQPNVYSGDYIVGIATMHKSNLVPVGKGQDPEELAKMRR